MLFFFWRFLTFLYCITALPSFFCTYGRMILCPLVCPTRFCTCTDVLQALGSRQRPAEHLHMSGGFTTHTWRWSRHGRPRPQHVFSSSKNTRMCADALQHICAVHMPDYQTWWRGSRGNIMGDWNFSLKENGKLVTIITFLCRNNSLPGLQFLATSRHVILTHHLHYRSNNTSQPGAEQSQVKSYDVLK